MKKLEDLRGKEFFKVPGGYFENLPSAISAKIAGTATRSTPVFRPVYWYAVPMVILLFALVYWLNRPGTGESAEMILASIDSEVLINYLAESDLTGDEIFGDPDAEFFDVDALEAEVFDLPAETMDEIKFDFETDSL